MKQPYYKYSVLKHRIQSKNSCTVYALTALVEKIYALADKKIGLDAEELAQKIRKHYGIKEDSPIDSVQALQYFKKEGLIMYFRRVSTDSFTGKYSVEKVRSFLRLLPMMMSISPDRHKSKRVSSGKFVAKRGDYRHMVNLWGTEKEGFTILDSHYTETYSMSEEKLLEVVNDIYYVNIH